MIEPGRDDDAGGESACFAHLVCPECGSIVDATHAPHPPASRTVANEYPKLDNN